MEIVQLAWAASDAPQLVAKAKSVGFGPPSTISVMVSALPPVLESVTICALLVCPMVNEPKESDVGFSETVAAVSPVPARGTL